MLLENSIPNPPVHEARVRWQDDWLLFEGLTHWFETTELKEVSAVLHAVEQAVAQGGYAVGFVAFEAAAAFDRAFPALDSANGLPLIAFGVFESVSTELATAPADLVALAIEEVGSTSDRGLEQYMRAFGEIQRAIGVGDVYQVNYTFPFSVTAADEVDSSTLAAALFDGLCGAQGGRYACALRAGSLEVLSASPELFFELDRGRLTTRPMKGTAPRGRFGAEDAALASALKRSSKDRAENLMIVDMMRNDLGRIANVGSIEVSSLFDVERLPTLHQMTSTVTAQTDACLAEVFEALFPCASITGAPKVAALGTIRQLEASARGIYTGAVGMVLPAHPSELGLRPLHGAHGEDTLDSTQPRPRSERAFARFNVAIRTAWRTDSTKPFHYGVGSGVVWDSEPESEHSECRSKALALTSPRPSFRVLETMLARLHRAHRHHAQELDRIWLLKEHQARLRSTADYFDIAFDEEELWSSVEKTLRRCNGRSRLRLLLDQTGDWSIEVSDEARRARRCGRVALAPLPVDSSNPFLFHKTTHRTVYEDAMTATRRIAPGVDDAVLWNERGELTESTVANIALSPDTAGQPWRTPSRESGLLAGTLRQRLIDRGRLVESVLLKRDLEHAKTIVLLNGVRGLIRAELVT